MANLFNLGKMLFGSIIVIGGMIVSVAIWVTKTDAEGETTRQNVAALTAARADSLKEWSQWRTTTDSFIARLIALEEAQQRSIERLEQINRQDRR